MICYIINKNNKDNYLKFEFSSYFIDDFVNIISSLDNIEDFYICFENKQKENL